MTKYEKYKLIILFTFGVIFSAIFYNFSENGRYVFHKDNTKMVLDSKEGKLHFIFDSVMFLDLKNSKELK